MAELLPCPFCGGTDIRRIITTSYCEIECHCCKAKISRGLFCGKYDCLADAENGFGKEANNAWNTRTPKETHEKHTQIHDNTPKERGAE